MVIHRSFLFKNAFLNINLGINLVTLTGIDCISLLSIPPTKTNAIAYVAIPTSMDIIVDRAFDIY